MFTLQAMGAARDLQAAGMPQEQAQTLARSIGNCQAPLDHSGPITLRGPVTFTQPPKIAIPGQGATRGQPFGSATGVDFAVLSEAMTAGSPYTAVKGALSEWSPGGFTGNGSQVDIWPGPLMGDGETLPAGTTVAVARNGERLVAISVGPTSTTGGIGSGGAGGYVAILQGDLAKDSSASARVARRSGGTWAEASPVVSITVYDAFLTGSEIIPGGYKVWIQRELDGNLWVVTGAAAN